MTYGNATETARKPPQRQKKRKKIAGYQLPDNHTWANRVNFAKVQKEMKQLEEEKQKQTDFLGPTLDSRVLLHVKKKGGVK